VSMSVLCVVCVCVHSVCVVCMRSWRTGARRRRERTECAQKNAKITRLSHSRLSTLCSREQSVGRMSTADHSPTIRRVQEWPHADHDLRIMWPTAT
jgi:hypothetical protein